MCRERVKPLSGNPRVGRNEGLGESQDTSFGIRRMERQGHIAQNLVNPSRYGSRVRLRDSQIIKGNRKDLVRLKRFAGAHFILSPFVLFLQRSGLTQVTGRFFVNAAKLLESIINENKSVINFGAPFQFCYVWKVSKFLVDVHAVSYEPGPANFEAII